MEYIKFDRSKKFDIILIGRATIDFNPVDYYKPLYECETFKKYVAVHLLILQWALHALKRNVVFLEEFLMTNSVNTS